ncbi:MAG: maleylpyruvate isomerase family mycothiol-dependent enzyme [Acidimicrobiales bacterium]
MELTEYVEHLRRDGAELLAAARRDPAARVPSCPDWDVTALLAHTGAVHAWVATILRTAATARPDRPRAEVSPPAFAAVAADFEAGLFDLAAALEAADPDALVWNWLAGQPAPARFWPRRMAQETTVHRWDAQEATGAAAPIDAALAADGVDEYLGFVAKTLAGAPIADLRGVLSLVATDDDASWGLELAPHSLSIRPSTGADATITASASDLYLWMLHRKAATDPGFSISGDPRIVDLWNAVRFE